MTYSPAGYERTKEYESCVLTAYQDPAGVWTIGWGHVGPEVVSGLVWTQEQADAALVSDMQDAIGCVGNPAFVKIPLNQNQFDSLVDFTFNCGRGNFLSSTLLWVLNQGNYAAVPAQIERWVHAGGKVLPGLVRRRQDEAKLFATPV